MQTGRSRWRVTASSSTEDRQRPKPIAAAPPFQTQPTCPPSRKTRRAAPARQAVLALVTRHGRARRCPRRTPRAELDLRPTSSTGVTITQPSSASSPRIERAESPARRSEAVGRRHLQVCSSSPATRSGVTNRHAAARKRVRIRQCAAVPPVARSRHVQKMSMAVSHCPDGAVTALDSASRSAVLLAVRPAGGRTGRRGSGRGSRGSDSNPLAAFVRRCGRSWLRRHP